MQSNKKALELVAQIIDLAGELGWHVGFFDPQKKEIAGLVLGTKDFLENLTVTKVKFVEVEDILGTPLPQEEEEIISEGVGEEKKKILQ